MSMDPPFFNAEGLASVRAFYRGVRPTPCLRMDGLATALGIGSLVVKDESARFGLEAFKVAGARYAVSELLKESSTPPTCLAAASTGNHGRAVARAARDHGLAARIYLPAGTLPSRISALESEGARVIVTDSGYDEAVRRMAHDADANGWTIVSDASWDGYDDVPRRIMLGYTLMLDEASLQMGGRRPDVVVVQAGVGSLAGAVAGWLDVTYGAERPRLVIAEPVGSACVMASLAAGERVTLDACEPTAMAGLWCAEVSPLAWPVIHAVADAAIGITEQENEDARHRLAESADGDPPVAAGPSGAAGVAALVKLATDPDLQAMRNALGLGPTSSVLAIVTEGRTDE